MQTSYLTQLLGVWIPYLVVNNRSSRIPFFWTNFYVDMWIVSAIPLKIPLVHKQSVLLLLSLNYMLSKNIDIIRIMVNHFLKAYDIQLKISYQTAKL